MAKKHQQILEELREMYDPYSDFFGSELTKIEALSEQYEKSQDPVFASFRDHPITRKYFQHAARIYRQSKMQLANDDGSLKQDERIRLYVSSLWALAWIRYVGGDPAKVQQEIEAQIEQAAESAGIDLSTSSDEG